MLNRALVEDVIAAALSTGGDFAEIYVEDRIASSLYMVGGVLEKSISGRDFGIGIRIFKGNNYLYAHTNDDSKDNLIKVAQDAAAALEGMGTLIPLNFNKVVITNKHPIKIHLDEVEVKDKVDILKRVHKSAKEYHDSISQVRLRYVDDDQRVFIANSEGLEAEDRRIRTRVVAEAVASYKGEMQVGIFGPGAHMGFEFYQKQIPEEIGVEAARIARTMVEAPYAPSGKMTVVIHNGFGGVIFHEACGHGLEATSVAKNISVFAGKLNQQVASKLVSAVDDGTLPNEWGSQNIDDEGSLIRRNLLIEDGILKGYLVDKLNGKRMGMEPTGSSRRQSYKYPPTSRMTNTYILPGNSSFDDIISSTEKGLFAKNLGGGSVNPGTGEFNFAVLEGYMIKNGKITNPVRGATLIGKGIEVLNNIDMVGNNLAHGQGNCGSVSGSVPTNVGQPTIRVSQLTVGGRKGE